MVLQRQLPARAPGQQTESGVAARHNGTQTNAHDGFSSALSGAKRPAAAAEDNPAEAEDDVGVAAASAEASEDLGGKAARLESDEMLTLLSGLGENAAPVEQPSQPIDANEIDADEPLGGAAGSVAAMPDQDPIEVAPAAGKLPATAPDMILSGATARPGVAQVAGLDAATRQHSGAALAVEQPAASQRRDAGPLAAEPGLAKAAMAASVTRPSSPDALAQAAQPAPATVVTPAAPGRRDSESAARETLRTLGLDPASPLIRSAGQAGQSDGKPGGGSGQRDARSGLPAEDRAELKPRNVEVLESRKFMAAPAPGLSGNGQLVANAVGQAGDAIMAAQRGAPVSQPQAVPGQPQRGQMLHTLKLQLNPASLGQVTAVLRLTGEELSVQIKVETAEAYRQLNNDNQSILKTLRAQGYGVEQITIQHVAAPDRPSGQAGPQGFQAGTQGNNSADAQASGREAGRQGSGHSGSNQRGGDRLEQTTPVGNGPMRADGVYL